MNKDENKESKMTVARALSELKMLQKRIDKTRDTTVFISTRVPGRVFKDHVKETQSSYKSLCDMMARYEKIKFAVISSNAQTRVTVGKKNLSVAEVIAERECMEQKRRVLEVMRAQRLRAEEEMTRYSEHLEDKMQKWISEMTSGKERASDFELKHLQDQFLEMNKMEYLDPLPQGLDVIIKNLDEEIDVFDKNVDFALSESNAVTVIDV